MRILGEIERVVGALECGLQVAQQRVDGLELRQLVLALPLPVTVGSWCAPMILTARKHHSPSDTTTAEVANDFAAHIATASVVKGCLEKHAYCGHP